MEARIQILLALLGPLLLAIFVAARLKHSPYVTKAKSEQLANDLEFVASILLPLIVLNVVRRTEISNALWWTFGIGFLLPPVVYIAVWIIAKLGFFPSMFESEGPTNRLLLSSFGGGNRGNLLILIAFGSQAAIGPSVIKHFVVLDLGNLMCLLTFGFWFVARASERKAELRLTEILGKVLRNPGTYAAILIFLQLPGFRETNLAKLISAFDSLLKGASPCLNALFAFSIFLAIFVRLERLVEVLHDTKSVMLSFICSRVTAVGVVFALLAGLEAQRELIIATTILAFMPPSSFLWTRIAQAIPAITKSSMRKSIYLVPNFLYFAMLLGAFLWGLL